jgi:hypothetical protein
MLPILGVAAVFLGTLGCLLVASELGYYLGRKRRERSDQEGRSQVSIVEGSLLGVLGLLLGFAFSMAVQRFDRRQELVVREANAIGTVNLRCDFLPAEARTAAAQKLKEYAEVRLRFFEAGSDRKEIDELFRQAGRLQADLWSLAREEAKARPTPVALGLVMAMNDLFDLTESQRAWQENTVPTTIWIVLYLVAILTTGSLGYGSGLAGHRLTLPVILVPLLTGIILTLLLDLDHPRQGLIHTSQASLHRVQDSLK